MSVGASLSLKHPTNGEYLRFPRPSAGTPPRVACGTGEACLLCKEGRHRQARLDQAPPLSAASARQESLTLSQRTPGSTKNVLSVAASRARSVNVEFNQVQQTLVSTIGVEVFKTLTPLGRRVTQGESTSRTSLPAKQGRLCIGHHVSLSLRHKPCVSVKTQLLRYSARREISLSCLRVQYHGRMQVMCCHVGSSPQNEGGRCSYSVAERMRFHMHRQRAAILEADASGVV